MVSRAGKSSLGCLTSLLILAAGVYFGVNLFEVYWRFYEFQDAMKQEVRFASQIPDDAMRRHLAAFADSAGLPEDAGHVIVKRGRVQGGTSVRVSADYFERVELPLFARDLHFAPHAEGRY